MPSSKNTGYSSIKQLVLKKIKPSRKEEEHAQKVLKDMKARLEKLLPKTNIIAGGSLAKGTWLKNNHDIDFFAQFKTTEELSNNPLAILETIGAIRVKGSRDYYQLTYKGFEIEIVPVLKVKNHLQAQNVTDMSVLHVQHVKKHMKVSQKDEVRLAKQFCKAHNIYGAESYIKGFSGHVLELLIMHYSSFKKLLEATNTWQEKVVLDPMGHHKKPEEIINQAKQHSPLLLIDPMQPQRNAAAALSQEAYNTFKKAAKKFLTKPSVSAFNKKPLTLSKIRALSGHKIIVELFSLPEKRDTAGTKCLKAFEYLTKNLSEFSIQKTGFDYDHKRGSALTYIIVQEEQLPKTYVRQGPPISAKEAVKNFKKTHKNTFEQEGRVCTHIPYDYRIAHKKVADLLMHELVTKRTTKTLLHK